MPTPTAKSLIQFKFLQNTLDLMSCDYKTLVVRLMCLSMYWLHTTVLQQYRSREKMIPKMILTNL